MQVLSRQRGVSLIEVLMAVLIFSIGLIGLAGLMVVSTKSNHAAYLRTQVTFLAGNMADRMRANPVGVWNNSYNSNSYPVSGSTAANADCSSGCTPDMLAEADKRNWSSQLNTFLPAAAAKINCDASSAGFTPAGWSPPSASSTAPAATPGQVGMRPPYGGTCHMEISWSEQGTGGSKSSTDAAKTSNTATQTFAWEFQP